MTKIVESSAQWDTVIEFLEGEELMSSFLQIGDLRVCQFQFLAQKLLHDSDMHRSVSMNRNNRYLTVRIAKNMMAATHTFQEPSFLVKQSNQLLPTQSGQLRQGNRAEWKWIATVVRVPAGSVFDRLPQCTRTKLSSNPLRQTPHFFLCHMRRHRAPTQPTASNPHQRKSLRKSLVAYGYYNTTCPFICSHSLKTSRRFFSHSRRVFPCAHTPWKPMICPKYVRLPSIRSYRALHAMTSWTPCVNMTASYHTTPSCIP